MYIKLLYIIETREIPTFGGISLALRGSGASGATFGRLQRPRWGTSAPIWETAAFGDGERDKKKIGESAYAAFGGDEKKKNLGRLRRPKWF